MAQITRDIYRQYAHRIVSVLKNEEFYEQFKTRVDKGTSNFKIAKKRLIQDISIDWIDTIEDVLPNLDNIVRNPRKFIVQEEDIVDVSLARSISTESVKFLAQHTNMISKVDKDGMVTPSKILNITKEESFEIYENRFIYTLLLKLKDFVTMRYDKIKKASATQDVLALDTESRFSLPSKKVTFRSEYFAQLSFDEVMRLDPETLTKIERVAKIDRIITDFLSSSFAKSMRNSAPVRPPIMRTNVILKEPNFKKALTLWQFIETYNVTGGFSTSDEVEEIDVDNESVEELKNMVALNSMLFESMYDQGETNLDMEDKEFGDFLRVGDMDFQKDEINRDEYAQKLDEQVENDEEEDNLQDGHVNETDEPAPTDKPQEPEQDEEKEPEKQPAPDDKSGKEIVQEVEKRIEVEVIKELPPKADQEEPDVDEDAEKFDKHLFDVRKLYKKPADDKLTAEDIAKVKDAIDRCLNAYRSVKQDEIELKAREHRIRRRKEDMQKRANAFAKSVATLEKSVSAKDKDKVKFGLDPVSFERAKIAQAKRELEMIEERKRRLEEIEQAKLAEQARLEAERLEAERLEAERIEAERKAEEERLEAERRAEEERLEAERRAEEEREAERRAEESAQNEQVPTDVEESEPTVTTQSEETESAETEQPEESETNETAQSEESENGEGSDVNEVAETSEEVPPVVETKDSEHIEPEQQEETKNVEQGDGDNAEDVFKEKEPEAEAIEPEAQAEEIKSEEPAEVPQEETGAEPAPEAEKKEEQIAPKNARKTSKKPATDKPKAPPKKAKRPKQIDVVDESKVSIGTISFKSGSGLPYDAMFVTGGQDRVNLKNRAETEKEKSDGE